MRKAYLIAAASLLAIIPSSASATVFVFSQGGYEEGATMTGSFTGEDTDNNGQISWFDGEVTDFNAAFSGNSLVGALAFDFADLFGLVYDLDGDIGDGLILDVEGIGAQDGSNLYVTGPGPIGLCDNVNICGSVTDGGFSSVTTELVRVTAVPEPATWAMMLIGFGAVGYGMRRRRRVTQALQIA